MGVRGGLWGWVGGGEGLSVWGGGKVACVRGGRIRGGGDWGLRKRERKGGGGGGGGGGLMQCSAVEC